MVDLKRRRVQTFIEASCNIPRRLPLVLAITGAFACTGEPDAMPSVPAPEARPTDQPSSGTPSAESRSCADGDLSHCALGPCDLRAPAGSLAAGISIELSLEPVPDYLRNDVEGDAMCRLRFPTGFVPAGGITLSMTLAKPSSSATIFRFVENRPTALSSARAGQKVAAIMKEDGLYGVTHEVTSPRISYQLAADAASTADVPGLLQTLSARGFGAVFFDGKQLFVGNGDRVLVYEGIPKGPSDRPRMILGAPDLDTLTGGASSAVIGGTVTAIWTDGHKLVVGAGARILVGARCPPRPSRQPTSCSDRPISEWAARTPEACRPLRWRGSKPSTPTALGSSSPTSATIDSSSGTSSRR